MMSDTLAEAADEIRRYRREFPHVYAPLDADIDALLSAMDRLRDTLDKPPPSLDPPTTATLASASALRHYKAYRATLPDGRRVVFYVSAVARSAPMIMAPPSLRRLVCEIGTLRNVTPAPGVHPALMMVRFLMRGIARLEESRTGATFGNSTELLERANERWQPAIERALDLDNGWCMTGADNISARFFPR
jgi:hypothetical protein